MSKIGPHIIKRVDTRVDSQTCRLKIKNNLCLRTKQGASVKNSSQIT